MKKNSLNKMLASSPVMGCILSLIGVISAHTISDTKTSKAQVPFAPIEHWVVIYLENHSFDNLYGKFKGADNIDSTIFNNQYLQRDPQGRVYDKLPAAARANTNDSLFQNLPNRPFLIDNYSAQHQKTGDLMHRFFQNQQQIHHGLNDQFASVNDAKALTLGYYNTDSLALYPYAQNYVLCDHFYQSSFGGSFINHQFLVAARAPIFKGAPASMVAKWEQGVLLKDGPLAVINGDTVAVNTVLSRIAPHAPMALDTTRMLPALTHTTIGDRLSEAKISWKWYSGGWNLAKKGMGDSVLFQYHHQPFAYFKNFQVGSISGEKHLRDEQDLWADLERKQWPEVVFWKPVGAENEHPGYANVSDGEKKVKSLVEKIQKSAYWKNTAIIITYDENGGFWDHSAPPKVDDFGPGTRIPALIISPFAKKKFIDKTTYETVSILKTLEERYGLKPLSSRDSLAQSLQNAFEF